MLLNSIPRIFGRNTFVLFDHDGSWRVVEAKATECTHARSCGTSHVPKIKNKKYRQSLLWKPPQTSLYKTRWMPKILRQDDDARWIWLQTYFESRTRLQTAWVSSLDFHSREFSAFDRTDYARPPKPRKQWNVEQPASDAVHKATIKGTLAYDAPAPLLKLL